jgi:predicted amidophosphoribosyltransferase
MEMMIFIIVVSLFAALLMKRLSQRRCPYCYESMYRQATVCPHCRTNLATGKPDEAA